MNEVVPGLTVIFKGDKTTDHDNYEEALSRLNFRCLPIPALSFEFCNSEETKKRLFSPNLYQGLILTSPRAVESLAHIIEQNEAEWMIKRLQWKNSHVFVVGETTAARAESLLGLESTGKESGNAHELASFIIKAVNKNYSKPLFFPCGNLKRETLPKILNSSEISFDSLVVYKTAPHPHLEQAIREVTCFLRNAKKSDFLTVYDDYSWGAHIGTIKGLPEYFIYFSPSGVGYTVEILNRLEIPVKKCKFVAIGPSTAEALKSHNIEVHGVAAKPNPAALVQAIANRCSSEEAENT